MKSKNKKSADKVAPGNETELNQAVKENGSVKDAVMEKLSKLSTKIFGVDKTKQLDGSENAQSVPQLANTIEKEGKTLVVEEDAPKAKKTIKEKLKALKSKISGIKKEDVRLASKKLAKRWFIDAFSGMALGLFATLIAGTIIEQFGKLIGNEFIQKTVAYIPKVVMGAGIGVGIAHTLKADKLTLISCMVAGMMGSFYAPILKVMDGTVLAFVMPAVGNPIGAYLTALVTCEFCKLYAGKTKFDILLIPIGAVLISTLVIITLCPPVDYVINAISKGMSIAMKWSPVVMGIVIAVVMGLLLTLPTSSAAIWIALTAGSSTEYYVLLAGGAAVAGCAAHMVGFAVASFRENKWSGLIAQGLGTSMLQIPNLMRNPRILIPAIVSSAIVGPLASGVFKLLCMPYGGGMGTAGLVGVFGTLEASTDVPMHMLVIGIILLFFVIPAIVSFVVSEILRKYNWIKKDDMKLDL
ncbi:MAG: PTS sugar transporter subunit IIC [Christensenellaceae bacterium]|nr:PTS sugar transporter subunit IIC [Christensenellaceae bacterium]